MADDELIAGDERRPDGDPDAGRGGLRRRRPAAGDREPTPRTSSRGLRSGNRGRPSSGIGSQGAAYATNWRYCGRTPGSTSNAPRRTPIAPVSGSRLQRRAPAGAAKALGPAVGRGVLAHELLPADDPQRTRGHARLRGGRSARASLAARAVAVRRARRRLVELEPHAATEAAAGDRLARHRLPAVCQSVSRRGSSGRAAQPLGVGEGVDLDDPAAPHREAHHRDGRPSRRHDHARGAVHQRRAHERATSRREHERLRATAARAADHRRARRAAHRRRRAARRRGRAPRAARRSRRRATAARNASTTSRWRREVGVGTRVAPCTRRRARLASCRAAAGVRPTIGAISSKGTANMSCSTNASRSAGASVSSTTSSARPTESASSASCSGSIAVGRGSRPARARARRAAPRGATCASAACPGRRARRRSSASRRGSRRSPCRRG